MSRRTTKTLIIQKDDNKSRKWREASMDMGLNIVIQKKSPIQAPWFLLKTFFTSQKPNGYVVRYLNDYPSFVKTTIRVLSEMTLIVLSKVLGVKLFWICHNVDKETDRYYPRFSSFRRKMMSRFCVKILVTDELLIKKAISVFPKHDYKIENISFGKVDLRVEGSGDDQSAQFLVNLRRKSVQQNRKFMSVLCAGAPNNPKFLHFTYLIDFIEKSKKEGYDVGVIVAGNWDNSARSKQLLARYRDNSNIFVFEKFTLFSASFIRKNIDCYFRGYDDFSVPFTVYEACSLDKPILAMDSGFLPSMVRHYKIGIIVDMDFADIGEAFKQFHFLDNNAFQDFFEKNNWSLLATKILPHL